MSVKRAVDVRPGILCLVVGLLVSPGARAVTPRSDDEPQTSAWDFEWDAGFELISPDGRHQLQFGGFFQFDVFEPLHVDPQLEEVVGEFERGSEFRRARLYFSGKIYGNLSFKAEYDFAGGDPEFKDVWIRFDDTPIGGIQIGHFREPFSLEALTSDKWGSFIERSLPTLFAPGRNNGVALSDQLGDWLGWAAGVFQQVDDVGTPVDGDALSLTGRLVWRPQYREAGRRLVHLGVAGTTRDSVGINDEFGLGGESHLAPDPPELDVLTDGQEVIGLEAATVQGPFWAAAEYIASRVDLAESPDVDFSGYYVQVGYILTGESRAYKTSRGAFDHTDPKRNLGAGGSGMWEVALRYSVTDLEDAELLGGVGEGVTLGVNWQPNPAARLMLNLLRSELRGVGSADSLTVRVQLVF